MMNHDMKKLERKSTSEGQMVDTIEEARDPIEAVVGSIEGELTDEQLLQMAEGSCSWGANCHGNR